MRDLESTRRRKSKHVVAQVVSFSSSRYPALRLSLSLPLSQDQSGKGVTSPFYARPNLLRSQGFLAITLRNCCRPHEEQDRSAHWLKSVPWGTVAVFNPLAEWIV